MAVGRVGRAMVAVTTAAAVTVMVAPAGHTTEPSSPRAVVASATDEVRLRSLDEVETAAAVEDLGIPEDVLGDRATVYGLDSGSVVVVQDKRHLHPRFSVGVGRAVYVYLNQTDQKAVKAGGGAAIGLAVCALPAVGQGACAGVMVVVAMATVYLTKNGFCPRAKPTLELRTAGIGVSARVMCLKR